MVTRHSSPLKSELPERKEEFCWGGVVCFIIVSVQVLHFESLYRNFDINLGPDLELDTYGSGHGGHTRSNGQLQV